MIISSLNIILWTQSMLALITTYTSIINQNNNKNAKKISNNEKKVTINPSKYV